ncbi:MAG: DUF2853 family protein [Bacteroidota bacterium]
MSKFQEMVDGYYTNMTEKLGLKNVDKELLAAVTKGIGPNIYRADASKVSSSDPDEMARVRNNFLIKKLGLADGPKLDEAIANVIDSMGKANKAKYRAVFYYLLIKELGQEKAYQ